MAVGTSAGCGATGSVASAPEQQPTSSPDGSSAMSPDSLAEDVTSKDCLFVANLPSSFTDDELEHHLRVLFAHYGTIRSTKASRDKKMRPFCFVQFEGTVNDAVFTQAHYLGGRPLRIERSRVKTAALPAVAWRPPVEALAQGPYAEFYEDAAADVPQAAHGHNHGHHMQPVYALQVTGLNASEMRRSLVFQRFKRYGYVVGIDLDYGAPPGSADAAFAGRAYVYYGTFDAVRRAIAAAHGEHFLGGEIACAFVPSMSVTLGPVFYGGSDDAPGHAPEDVLEKAGGSVYAGARGDNAGGAAAEQSPAATAKRSDAQHTFVAPAGSMQPNSAA